MGFLSMCFCFSGNGDRNEEESKKEHWRVFSYKELVKATNSFNYDNMIGEGQFGRVYWGQLWDGSQIAVKRFKDLDGDKDKMLFSINVQILCRVRHKYLLALRGYCTEGKEYLVVYDYMPNLSLLSHLRGHFAEWLNWERRMNIAIETAKGIAYLHHQAIPNMLHGDIRASNVLLDTNFQPKVSDFGFPKFLPGEAKFTHGYLAPEYLLHGKLSKSTDTYSFGILLLELVSGKKSREKITEWALTLARERRFSEVVDQNLDGKYIEDEVKRVILVAGLCLETLAEKRPSMLEVVELLKDGSLEKLNYLI